jgi:RNA polymerase subunit RPABC4/transcription elongation factor Spt4
MITCSNCGAGIPDDVEFCQQCGAPRPESEDVSSTEIVIDPPLEEVPPELDAQEWVPEEPASEVEPELVIQPEPAPAPQTYQAPQTVETQPRKSNTCLWVVFSCLVLFLVCVCVLLVVVGLSLSFVQGIFDGIFAFNFLAFNV